MLKKYYQLVRKRNRRNVKALPVKHERIEKLWIGVEAPTHVENKDTIRNRFKLNSNDTIIALPGRITQAKGHLNLLIAFKF